MSELHGETNLGKRKMTKEYYTWAGMSRRCYNKNNSKYEYYGGRGIKVCKRWKKSYLTFLKDMGRAPSKQHSLDRINNDKDYCPSNCKWSTKDEQAQNRKFVKVNKFIVQYIRQREANDRTIQKELNNICAIPTINHIRHRRTWTNF